MYPRWQRLTGLFTLAIFLIANGPLNLAALASALRINAHQSCKVISSRSACDGNHVSCCCEDCCCEETEGTSGCSCEVSCPDQDVTTRSCANASGHSRCPAGPLCPHCPHCPAGCCWCCAAKVPCCLSASSGSMADTPALGDYLPASSASLPASPARELFQPPRA
jgi:hypothetical protein